MAWLVRASKHVVGYCWPMGKIMVLAPVLALIALGSAPTADACSCVPPRVRMMAGRIDATLVVPRNAQIRVGIPDEAFKVDPNTVMLVSTAKSGPPANVPVDRKVFTTGAIQNVVLTPKSPLLAKTAYRVMAVTEKGGAPQLVGEVMTDDTVDDEAPTWSGTVTGYLDKTPAVCCICQTGEPYFVLSVGTDAKDNTTKPDDFAWGVWAGSPTFDPKAPMLAMVGAYRGKTSLGHSSICSPSNFDVPATGKTSVLWIAPIDLAGNIGTPAKVTIDLTKPVTK